jgi:hypothetical protein
MSLFERLDYTWRETYFVYFDEAQRPKVSDMRRLFTSMGDRFEVVDVRGDSQGMFESMTVLAPADLAGLDIVYCSKEDMEAEKEQILKELERAAHTPSGQQKLEKVRRSSARFEIFHFEHTGGAETDDEDFDDALQMDPGGLLTALAKLVHFTHGVAVDPQAGEFV